MQRKLRCMAARRRAVRSLSASTTSIHNLWEKWGCNSPPKGDKMRSGNTLKLNNGTEIPRLAFGMYKIGQDCDDIVLDAIEAGYRHFDTASFYGNEDTLGRAMKKSGIERKEFYVCTKVWNDAQKEGRVRESVEASLRNLQTDYIDLFLIHWPVPSYFVQTYKLLEGLVEEGKIRSLGLSNFSEAEYRELVDGGITIAPVVNQFEVSPAMYRPELLQFFASKKMVVSSSKSLHRGDCLDNGTITSIANKHGKTSAQVMLRWSYQHDLVVVAKTANKKRMKENRDILNFELTTEEMAELGGLTDPKDVRARAELEELRKSQM